MGEVDAGHVGQDLRVDPGDLFSEPEELGQRDESGQRASRSSSSLSRLRSRPARAVKSLSARTRAISAERDSMMSAFTLGRHTRHGTTRELAGRKGPSGRYLVQSSTYDLVGSREGQSTIRKSIV